MGPNFSLRRQTRLPLLQREASRHREVDRALNGSIPPVHPRKKQKNEDFRTASSNSEQRSVKATNSSDFQIFKAKRS